MSIGIYSVEELIFQDKTKKKKRSGMAPPLEVQDVVLVRILQRQFELTIN